MVKATIIIPTRNRKEVLFKTLRNLQSLNDPNPEIMVYDDASEEDYTQELTKIFPEVRFLRSSVQLGPCELRNRMIREAGGVFVIGLDDDSYFINIEDYRKSIQSIENSSNIGLVGFKVTTRDGIQFPRSLRGSFYHSAGFMGCGFIAAKEALLKVGAFDSLLLRAGEERDLAIRIIDFGFDILQHNDIEVFHELIDCSRDHQFIHGYAFRNELFFYLKFFPGIFVPIFIMKCFVSHTVYCFRKLWLKAYIFGIVRFFLDFPKFIVKRKPVKVKTLMKYLLLLK